MTVETNSACGSRNNGPERQDSLRSFGAVLAAFRKRAGLTQEQLAPHLQYSVQMLASVEQGRHFPRTDFVERAWFKSSYSGGSGDSCVEVAASPGTVHVRDSKATDGPQLALSPVQWLAFVAYTCAAD